MKTLICCLALVVASYAAETGFDYNTISCDHVTTTGACTQFNIHSGDNIESHSPSAETFTWQTSFAGGTPTSVTVAFQGSLDNSTWFTLDTSTSTAGETRSISGTSAKYFRCNVTAYSRNGTSLTCQFVVSSASLAGRKWSCQTGLGDGLNAISSGTYLQSYCYNDTGSTLTISGIRGYTDAGTVTLNATNGAGTALLTGAITCSTSFAAGTQGATTTLASGDFIKFTFVADGTAKQTTWVVTGSY